ncbi:MAG: hypothetical protein ACREH5_08325 [Candidatus Omnitrophota bacterium]
MEKTAVYPDWIARLNELVPPWLYALAGALALVLALWLVKRPFPVPKF